MKAAPLIKKLLIRYCVSFVLIMGGVIIYSKLSAPALPQIPAPVAPPSPNGFDVYVAAAQSLIPAKPPVDQVNNVQRLSPQQAAVQYSPQRRRAWIAANATTWQKMAQAKSLRSQAPNMRGNLNMSPAWKQLRELSRAQYIRSKDAKASGQWGEAATLGLDNLEMGLNVEHGSNLIGSLVGMAIQAIALASLEDVPAHLDATQAKAATKRLETLLGKSQPFSQTLTEEKWNMMVNWNSAAGASGNDVFSKIGVLFLPQAVASTQEMMDKFIAEADKPVGAQAAVAPPIGLMASYSGVFFPTTQKSFFNDARRKANERLFLLRLALRAYRVERGSYPAQLSALSPAYLQSVPADPFGKGEPLRYSGKGDSYVAWSIGPDAIDNKGVSIPPKSPQKRVVASANSKGDIIVRP